MSRERAGNILALGSRSAELARLPSTDQRQGELGLHPKDHASEGEIEKGSMVGVQHLGTSEHRKQPVWSLADHAGLSPTPSRAPPQKLLPAPNTVPTGNVGKRHHQMQKTLGLRHGKEPPRGPSGRASWRRGHLGRARKAGAVALPLSHSPAPTRAYLCQALTQIWS